MIWSKTVDKQAPVTWWKHPAAYLSMPAVGWISLIKAKKDRKLISYRLYGPSDTKATSNFSMSRIRKIKLTEVFAGSSAEISSGQYSEYSDHGRLSREWEAAHWHGTDWNFLSKIPLHPFPETFCYHDAIKF